MNIDGGNAPFWVNAAAQGAAAVDHRHADLRFRRLALFKAVHRFPAGEFAQLVDDSRPGARGDVDDFFAFGGVELQRAAPATRAFFNADPAHAVAPLSWTFCSS